MQPAQLAEHDLTQSICRESFYEFVKEFWDTIIPERPVWNWHIEFLCDELQVVAERVFAGRPKAYDLIINISPGTTKSTLVSILYPAWIWTRMPTARMISGSYEQLLSLNFARKSRDVVKDEKYQAAFGPTLMRGDQDTKGFYENEDGGDRKAIGAGGNITGSHGHFILIDDPINPKEAVSPPGLKAINEWMDETLPSRKVDKAVTPTILVMQRLHQDDPTGHMLSKMEKAGRIRHICLPADDSYEIKPASLKARYVDGLMDPKRLSRAILEEQRAALGEYGYAGQYGQSPVPRGGGMFQTERILADSPPRHWAIRVRFWDKAGTKGGGAYTVGTLMGLDLQGRFWILDVIRHQLDSSSREALIRQTAEIDGVDIIVGVEQEPGSGGKESAENTVRNLRGFRVRVDRPTGDKVMRADPFSVQVNAGNVSIQKGAPWAREYLSELRFFPFGTYKDQVDSSSAAFALCNAQRRKVGAL